MMRFNKLCLLLILIVLGMQSATSNTLAVKRGLNDYNIILSCDASESEKTGAKELRTYLKIICGIDFKITDTVGLNNIYIGYHKRILRKAKIRKLKDDDETFYYKSIGNDLLIYGGRNRGTMYGVFAFLENELGVRWYTPDCTIIPKLDKIVLSGYNHKETPALQYRFHNYFITNSDFVWRAHNRMNMHALYGTNSYGGYEAIWNCHTMGQFVSVDDFFDEHPEYFALRDGKRNKEGQLCLSNPDVLKICQEKLIAQIKKEPNYLAYSLSINDNYFFCTCDKCKYYEEKYGGHSGLIIWFVNQVAEAIEEPFPGKYISTLAYLYAIPAPTKIKPRDNVMIRICSIEACHLHPLAMKCNYRMARSDIFLTALNDWSRLTKNIFVWDYVVNWHHLLVPYPNFYTLSPNIQTFVHSNVVGVLEHASYQSQGSAFEELKSWVLAKLMWNPYQETRALVREFISGYYGKAASYIQEYFDYTQSVVSEDEHLVIFADPSYNIHFIEDGFRIINNAEKAAEDEVIKERVERVKMQLLYMKCYLNKEECEKDGTWDKLVLLGKKYKIQLKEGVKFEESIREF